MRKRHGVKEVCLHYRAMMAECRTCEIGDAIFKICYKKKKHSLYNRNGKPVFK